MSKENVTEGVCIDIYNLLKFRDDAYNAITDVCAHCSDLMEKVEELERQHKADQKAVEEANQLAETYMKRCQELYDEKNKAEKESLKSRAAEMVRSVHEIGISVIDLEAPTWESISKIVKDEKLKYLKSYSTKDLVDELKKRDGVSHKHAKEFETFVTSGAGDVVFVYDRKGD